MPKIKLNLSITSLELKKKSIIAVDKMGLRAIKPPSNCHYRRRIN
jgi:hypothetical protein